MASITHSTWIIFPPIAIKFNTYHERTQVHISQLERYLRMWCRSRNVSGNLIISNNNKFFILIERKKKKAQLARDFINIRDVFELNYLNLYNKIVINYCSFFFFLKRDVHNRAYYLINTVRRKTLEFQEQIFINIDISNLLVIKFTPVKTNKYWRSKQFFWRRISFIDRKYADVLDILEKFSTYCTFGA